MFERFSQSARQTMLAARYEAGRLGHRYIGTEHLLLGLLGRDGSAAEPAGSIVARVLAESDVDATYVRAQVVKLSGVGPDGLGDDDADALHAIGIDLDAVRSALEESFGEGVLDQPRDDRSAGRLGLTRRAKKVLGLSLREARQLNSSVLGAEHLLLGIIREGNGMAAQILAMRAPLDTFKERLLAELDRAA